VRGGTSLSIKLTGVQLRYSLNRSLFDEPNTLLAVAPEE
jgi:hypothetical protein